MAVKAIPEGYHSITPGMALKGCDKAIEFFKKVFGAEERMRFEGPPGQIAHCELRIGDSVVMLGDAHGEIMNMHVNLYVQDCDTVFNRAVQNGAKVKEPLQDKFYGDRSGKVLDPWGNTWNIATHKEDVPPAEMEKRAKSAMQQHQ